MSKDEKEMSATGRRQRRPKINRRASMFSSNRSSFLSAYEIHQRESKKSLGERLSLRRRSKEFSDTVDETDVLNPKTRIRIEWKDIDVSIINKNIFGRKKNEERIVCGVSGSIKPGTTVAILGPSGAGKSTLLNVLAGKTDNCVVNGNIWINGVERTKEHLQVISFIEQDSPYLDDFLTVQETLEMVAELALPSSCSMEEKVRRIDNVMEKTGIERISQSMVRGISGGERKRLAIAKELLRDPKVILLDEPTSGLDASTSIGLVKFLRELAIIDHLTIIMTIHQPRIGVLSKFDFFILLAQGKIVFTGDVDEAFEHFKKQNFEFTKGENPADFFLDILSTTDEDGDAAFIKLQQVWEPISKSIADEIQINTSTISTEQLTKFKHPTRRYHEFKVLLKWRFRFIFRDRNYRASLILEFIARFLIIMSVFFQIPINGFAAVQNRLGFAPMVAFESAALTSFCHFINHIKPRVTDERRSSRYRLSSFYIACTLFEIFLWGIIPIPFWIGLYYIAHFRYSPFTALLIFLAFQIGYLIAALFIGGIFGALIDDYGSSIRLITMFWLVCTIFAGVSVNTNNISPVLSWLRYISAPYYFLSGSLQNEFVGQTINGQPGIYWIDTYGLDGASEMWCAGAILIMIFGLFIIGYLALNFKTRSKFCI